MRHGDKPRTWTSSPVSQHPCPMQSIKVTESTSGLLVAFPFELREAFRAVFRTAPWDGARRAYVVKSTTGNKNKLAQFIAAAEPLLAAMTEADESEASVRELERLRDEIDVARRQIEERSARASTARKQLAELRVVLDPLAAQAAAAHVALKTIEDERQMVLAPVKALCDELGVPKAIASLRYFSTRTVMTREHKDEFDERCRSLRAANAKLGTALGIMLPVLEELADANYNRLDKLRSVLARCEDVYVGLRTVVV